MANDNKPDPIGNLITNQKVLDTVPDMKSMQEQCLSKIQELAGIGDSLISGLTDTLSNATNIISGTIEGIVGNIADSISNFAQTVDNGIKTSLADLSKKMGSAVGELGGQCSGGSCSKKLSFIVDLANPEVTSTSLCGKGGSATDLADSLSECAKNKMSKCCGGGKRSICNNSDVSNAICNITKSISSCCASARSIVDTVKSIPETAVSAVSGLVNNTVNQLISSTTNAVKNLTGISGLGDKTSLAKDMLELYSLGRDTYDLISGKADNGVGQALVGYASKFNSSFSEIQGLMKTAAKICNSLNGNMLQNYSANKDLMDLLLSRFAGNGMYGAINDLMNCGQTQQYITEDTFKVLANEFTKSTTKGDVYTAATCQQYAGNGRIANSTTKMKTLATTVGSTKNEIDAYSGLAKSMGFTDMALFGDTYTSSSNTTFSAYNASRISTSAITNPNLTKTLCGNSTTALAQGLMKAKAA